MPIPKANNNELEFTRNLRGRFNINSLLKYGC
jgi:hypothetical protein